MAKKASQGSGRGGHAQAGPTNHTRQVCHRAPVTCGQTDELPFGRNSATKQKFLCGNTAKTMHDTKMARLWNAGWPLLAGVVCAIVSWYVFGRFCTIRYPWFFFDEKYYLSLARSFHESNMFIYEQHIIPSLRVLYAMVASLFFHQSNDVIHVYHALQSFNHLMFSCAGLVWLVGAMVVLRESGRRQHWYVPVLVALCAWVMPGRLYGSAALPEGMFALAFSLAFWSMVSLIYKYSLWRAILCAAAFVIAYLVKQQILILVPTAVVACVFLKCSALTRTAMPWWRCIIAAATMAIVIAGLATQDAGLHYWRMLKIAVTASPSCLEYLKCFALQFVALLWASGVVPVVLLAVAVCDPRCRLQLSGTQRTATVLVFALAVALLVGVTVYEAVRNVNLLSRDVSTRYYLAFLPALWAVTLTLPAGILQQRHIAIFCWCALLLVLACVPFITQLRIDENGIDICAWYSLARPGVITSLMAGTFLIIWLFAQISILRIHPALLGVVLAAGLCVSTAMGAIRIHHYARTAYAERGVPLAGWLNRLVPPDAPLVYVGGGTDQALFLTEILTPRRMARFLSVIKTQDFIYTLCSSRLFAGTKYVIAPSSLPLPGVVVESNNGYAVARIDSAKACIATSVAVDGITEYGTILSNWLLITCSGSFSGVDLLLDTYSARTKGLHVVTAHRVSNGKRERMIIPVTGGITPVHLEFGSSGRSTHEAAIVLTHGCLRLQSLQTHSHIE